MGWHSTVQKKWKDVVERACQARAEEVCVQISNDYENKVAVVKLIFFYLFLLSFNRNKQDG